MTEASVHRTATIRHREVRTGDFLPVAPKALRLVTVYLTVQIDQPPSESQRFTVLREHPSSLAIRFVPQPRACSASIADTSSGVRISILRDNPARERSCNDCLSM